MTTRMNWDDYRFFLVVARSGNFSAAARELKIDRKTVARRLSLLESSLGAPLFSRLPDRCELNSEGDAILTHVKEMERAVIAVQKRFCAADL